MGPADGPNYNHPNPPPCATGPMSKGGDLALPLYNATLNCGGDPTNCNKQIVQQPLREIELDSNYATYLGDFIDQHAAGTGAAPFFAYMAFSHTHVPLFYDPKFRNSSARNTIFADTTMELDDTINRIWTSVKNAGIENETLILMTSDNGPWSVKCDLAGSAGPYQGLYQKQLGGGSTLKDTTWEGGQRVFGVAYWPSKITPGIVSDATVSSLDFLPTILALAGVNLPTDRSYDGVDLAPVLFDGASSVRDFLFMTDTVGGARHANVTSVRYKNYKAYTRTYAQEGCTERAGNTTDWPNYLVFDLTADPGESTPITLPSSVMDIIWSKHHALLLDINNTFKSITDYSSGTMIADAPCCNAKNAGCRCIANAINVEGDVDADAI